MTRTITRLAVAACLAVGLGGTASAQSLGAPAGRDPATAPGGTEGLAGPRNEAEAIRGGDAVPVPPGAGGVPVETTPPMTAPDAPMAPPPGARQ